MIAADMSRHLDGQAVIVDNKPGASGNIGAAYVAKSPPDGYTLLVGYSMFHVGNPSMFKDLAWDPVRDFSSVAMVAGVAARDRGAPFGSRANAEGAGGAREARARQAQLRLARQRLRSACRMELFKQQTGIDIVHVPLQGRGPMMQDVVGGAVQVTIATPPSILGFVQSGRVRALAVAAKDRHPLMPNVPTTAEAGYPDFELEAWVALFAPAGTPPEVIAKLTAATQDALKSRPWSSGRALPA
jgi:tripartite-type tricarboxylate transporter receptor subunit TctC